MARPPTHRLSRRPRERQRFRRSTLATIMIAGMALTACGGSGHVAAVPTTPPSTTPPSTTPPSTTPPTTASPSTPASTLSRGASPTQVVAAFFAAYIAGSDEACSYFPGAGSVGNCDLQGDEAGTSVRIAKTMVVGNEALVAISGQICGSLPNLMSLTENTGCVSADPANDMPTSESQFSDDYNIPAQGDPDTVNISPVALQERGGTWYMEGMGTCIAC
jgi:hypothetical protein